MGYVIKHSTSNVNKTRRKGNVAIGVDSSGYDKTSVSGFYAGVPPVEGKHNFVRTAAGGNPNFYSLTDEELINFVNGLGERNLTTTTPSQTGWQGSYSLTDSDTRTFNLTTQQNNAATTSAWRTWYWDVSDYIGQTVAISADVEFVSETNCTWRDITIGQGNTGQYTLHIAGSDAADKVTVSTKPTTPIRMEWSGSINATGIVGFTQWINNVTTNGANAVIKVSNVQIEAQDHVTEYSNPDKVVLTSFEALQYLSDREDIIFTDNIATKNIVTDGLVLDLNSRIKSSFRDNLPTENSARVDTWSSTWNNSGTATWNSNDTNVPRFFPDITVHSMVKDTNGNSHLGVGYTTDISEGVECTYSLYVWIPSSNSAGMSGAPPYMRPFPANYNATYLSYNGSTSWGSWPRDQWIRIEGTATPASNANGGISTAYISSYLNTAGDVVYYTAPQFENKSSATPFVSGSRSQNTTWYDLSGNGNATAVNSPVFSNNSFTFDQTNEYFSLTNNELNNISGSVTLMGVCKQGSTGSPHQTVLCTDINYRNGLKLMSRYHGAAAAWIGNSDGTNSYLLSSGVDITNDGKWHHLATTRNNSTGTLKIYVDGILKNSVNTYTGATSRANIAAVGVDYHSSAYYYVGNISSVKAYDQVLTDSEVSQNYYGGDIITNGLVLAMDAGNLVSYESGSTTAYSMTGSLSGSLVNGVAYTGSKGGVWVFDGSNDKITSSAPLSAGASTYTIEAIFKPASQKTQVIWEQNSSTLQNGKRVCMILIADGDGGFNGQSADRHDHMPYTVGEWHHWTITVDNSLSTNKIKMYANGELINQGNPSSTLNAGADSASIGSKVSTNTEYFDGDIGVVRVYNKVLTPSEVLQNYNAQKARFI